MRPTQMVSRIWDKARRPAAQWVRWAIVQRLLGIRHNDAANGIARIRTIDQRKIVGCNGKAELFLQHAQRIRFFIAQTEKIGKLFRRADEVPQLPSPVVPFFGRNIAPRAGRLSPAGRGSLRGDGNVGHLGLSRGTLAFCG